MSGSEDLKDLLDRLKRETPPPASEEPRGGLHPAAAAPRRFQPYREREREPQPAPRPYRAPEPRSEEPMERPEHAFSENKETLLFGMLAGLVVALGGVLSGLEYVALAGTVIFAVFALLLAAVMALGFVFARRRFHRDQAGLTERVDSLSRRVEMLSSRVASQPAAAQHAGGPGRDPELEQKVEELRVLVKSLSKALKDGGK